ncbi:hypothetical protein EG329_012278 [Mollisiaceae sp. DMI_Dod_QoI]|nr:hypothetical protein EG329_012278 [Helotiales sp. DMI_Dod_QoI]
MQQLRSSLPSLTNFLHTFASSPSTFRLLTTITSTSPFPPSPTQSPPSTPFLPPPKTLYVLDSSFNPPTRAHLRIATSALLHDTHPTTPPKRLLLLLATQNADKAPKPASFEHRLIMMQIFAHDLLSTLSSQTQTQTQSNPSNPSPPPEEEITIDIGVTKLPYFHSKAQSITSSSTYPEETTQIHLLGYDTLTRLLDTKYYAPTHSLAVLRPFLSRHRIRVTYREGSGDEYGDRQAQDRYVRELGEGKREFEGGEREWVVGGRIEMVEGRKEGEEVISSTRVRGAATAGDKELLDKLVTKGVREWVLGEKLYLDD